MDQVFGMMLMRLLIVMLLAQSCEGQATHPHHWEAMKATYNTPSSSSSNPRKFPAMFVFGDSLSDTGNNNFITSVAKADKLPYGVDFPTGPNGRFTNGKLVIDFLCERLSLPPRPTYLDPTTRGPKLLQGVSYASGSSGLLRATGYNFLGRVYLETQLSWFSNTIAELKQMIGEEATNVLLAKSLFTLSVGSNDYINNYLLEFSPTKFRFTPTEFQDLLLRHLSGYLDRLYEMGARNMFVFALGPLGCIPSQLIAQHSVNGECSNFVNNLVLGYNQGLRLLVDQFNSKNDASFEYIDSFALFLDIANNPHSYGFKHAAQACCGVGKFNAQVLCLPILHPCSNREDYVFFDGFHPTEKTYRLVANATFLKLGL